MKVEVLNTEVFKSTTPEILGLDFDLNNLKIRYSTAKDKEYDILFENPIAFKLLDEFDLGKYLKDDTITSNMIFEIKEGGFLTNEKENGSFISDQISQQREFLIKGIDDCLFVIAPNKPKIKKVNLKNVQLKQIVTQLKRDANRNTAYFGFNEWTEHEYCIKANTDGLKLFASILLEAAEIEEEGKSHGLNKEEIEWLYDELEIDFIEWTNKNREDLVNNTPKEAGIKWWNFLLWIGLGGIGYLIIAGVIFTIKWITGTF
jgi:hypothetical protein